MMKVEVEIEGFRSLRRARSYRIAPVTLIVGENSSGKSAFLAATSACLRGPVQQPKLLSEEPYYLSMPRTQISEGAARMVLGCTKTDERGVLKFFSTYSNKRDFWTPDTFAVSLDTAINLTGIKRQRLHQFQAHGHVASPGGYIQHSTQIPESHVGIYVNNFMNEMIREYYRHFPLNVRVPAGATPYGSLYRIGTRSNVYSLSPIRTRPQRIYETRSGPKSAEGEHVPQILDKLLTSRSLSSTNFRNRLYEFAGDAGLFTKVKSRKYETPAGRHFSISVDGNGSLQTIQDVGYGVSQALPIFVELLTSESDFVLIQQPEVHLHPRSQAALATLFCNVAREEQRYIVVETHSDYIVDRVRVEIKKGNFNSEDVVIYFFEKSEEGAKVHEIRIDGAGNLENAPDGFRSFFLKEQFELMGIWEN